jgi:hypothetical protein
MQPLDMRRRCATSRARKLYASLGFEERATLRLLRVRRRVR